MRGGSKTAGLKSTFLKNRGNRQAPGKDSLASAHDGGAGSRKSPAGLGSRKSQLDTHNRKPGGKRLG